MTSPVIAGAATSATSTAGTNHTVTLPGSISAGDLLLVLMNIGSTAATLNAHADYTELLDENNAAGLKILYRWAAGGETNPTFVSSASTRDATITYRITGAENPSTQAPEIGTTATSTDPPTVTPTGGAKDYLFIAMVGSGGEQADDGTFCTAFPTNFTDSQQEKTCGVAGTNLGGLIAAAGFRTNASSSNPSAFTISEATTPRSQTIAVHPASAVDATATPSTVGAIGAVPAPTLLATAVVVATSVAAIAGIGTPNIPPSTEASAGLIFLWQPQAVSGDNTAIPDTVAAIASVPASTILAAAIATPATVVATGAVPAPTILAAAKPTPSTVVAIAAVPAPTVLATAIVTPATVVAVAAVPAPTVKAAAIVQPSTVAAIADVPAPSILVGGNATVSAATVVAIGAVPAPTVSGTAQVAPSMVIAIAAVPAPTLKAAAVVTGVTVTGVVAIPTPLVFGVPPADPVKGPTYARSLVGAGVTSSELAGATRASSLVGDDVDSEELAGAPRAVLIGAGSNSLQET